MDLLQAAGDYQNAINAHNQSVEAHRKATAQQVAAQEAVDQAQLDADAALDVYTQTQEELAVARAAYEAAVFEVAPNRSKAHRAFAETPEEKVPEKKTPGTGDKQGG